MHATALLTTLLAAATTTAAAAAVADGQPGSTSWGWGKHAWGQPCDPSVCSPAVIALATGIHLNIVGQYEELNATTSLQAIEAAQPINATAFEQGKGMLIAAVAAGMKIREFNQAVAPAGNAALPGLAQYAAAQATEASLALQLTGVPAHDADLLSTLVKDINAGIQLNEYNLGNATLGCNLGVDFPSYNL